MGQNAGRALSNALSSSTKDISSADGAVREYNKTLAATEQAHIKAAESAVVSFAKMSAAAVAASAAVVTAMSKIADTFEEINRGLTTTTLATGAQLDALKSQADNLVGTLDTAINKVGTDMGTLTNRLGLTGQALSDVTGNIERLRDRFGSFNVDQFTATLIQFGEQGANVNERLANLQHTVREFDVPMSELQEGLATGSTIFKELGINSEQAAHMIGEAHRATIPLTAGLQGMEMAAKAWKQVAPNEPFAQFIEEAAQKMRDYDAAGNQAARDMIANDVFGVRRWIQAEQLAEILRQTVLSLPDAFRGNTEEMQQFFRDSQTLHNLWLEMRNTIEHALMPVALNVAEDMRTKLGDLVTWVNAHQHDLQVMFKEAFDASLMLIEALAKIGGFLAAHPGLIEGVVSAFAAWKTIEGVTALTSMLTNIGRLLSVTLPEEAATGAAGISAALAGIEIPAALVAFLGTEFWANLHRAQAEQRAKEQPGLEAPGGPLTHPTIPPGPAAQANVPLDINTPWGVNPVLDDARRRLGLQPGQAPPPLPGAPQGPGLTPGMTTGPGPPVPLPPPPPPGTPGAPGAPGGPAAPPPGQTDSGSWGLESFGTHKLPPAPQIPMPPEFGAPPEPGESAAHWRDRMEVIKAQHQVAEDRARVDQLEQQGVGNEDDIVKAKNKLVEDQFAVQEKEQALAKAAREKIEIPYAPGYGAPPRPGESAQRYGEEQSYMEAQHKVAAAQASLTAVQQDATHTAEQLTKASNDLATAKKDENEAYLRLTQSSKGATDEFAKLDKDFGISKGLPGIAENLIKFAVNLAAAPAYGRLEAQKAAAGGVPQGAGGLIGMAAAEGKFGPQYAAQPNPPAPWTEPPAVSTPSVPTPSTIGDVATAGHRVSALYALAASLAGTPYSQALRNDCSGIVSEVAAAAVGLSPPEASQRFNTANEGAWLQSHGFQSGKGPPGTLRIGWSSEHTAATLPGGENIESTGPAGAPARLGPGAGGYNEPGFTNWAYLPMSGFDDGGLLQPGVTVAANNTGRPELVTPVAGGGIDFSNPTGPPPGPTPIGGVAPSSGTGSGVSGVTGGAQGAAISAGAAAANAFAPGAGIAAQIGIQEISRAIGFGAQAAGIGVKGVMDTFLPTGGSQLAQSNWITRIAGGVAGARPQLPNVAGEKTKQQRQEETGLGGAAQHIENQHLAPQINIEHLHTDNPSQAADTISSQLQNSYNANAVTGAR